MKAERWPERKRQGGANAALLALGHELHHAAAELEYAFDELRRLAPALAQQVFLRHVLAPLPATIRAGLPTPVVDGWAEAVARANRASATLTAAKQRGRRILKEVRLQERRPGQHAGACPR